MNLKNFIVLERIPKAPPYLFSLADAEFVNSYFRNIHQIDKSPGAHLNIYEDQDFLFCYQLDDLRECTQAIFEKLIANPHWGIELDNLVLEKAEEFFTYSEEVRNKKISELSNDELVGINQKWFFKYFHDSWLSGWPAVLVDFERNLFSDYLLDYLKQKIKTKKYPVSVGDVFSILTTPLRNTYAEKEFRSLLNLLEMAQNDTRLIKQAKTGGWLEFDKHYQDHCWMPFMYTGPVWSRDYFIDSLNGFLKEGVDPQVRLQEVEDNKKELEDLQEKYHQDLEIHNQFKTLFEVAKRFVYAKSYRKDAMYFSCYVIDQVLREIAKRTYLSVDQVRRVYPWEIEGLLKGQGPDQEIINQRKYAVQYSDNQGRQTYEGDKAREFVKKIEFVEQETQTPSQILGDCASVGKVRGLVKLINSPQDMAKMEPGNILVSYATSPDIMPAIKKSVAIVTDLGGIICHAAIVSRELRIPCVVGTKNATKVLKDGDLVEVDATHGIVRIII
ncbi:MAG: PEP-utilizing enzyme [bacterium]